jgi:hypothetical protein
MATPRRVSSSLAGLALAPPLIRRIDSPVIAGEAMALGDVVHALGESY